LVDAHLLERRVETEKRDGPGRAAVYYRVPYIYPEVWFASKEDIIRKLQEEILNQKKLALKLIAVTQLLVNRDPSLDMGRAVEEWLMDNEPRARQEANDMVQFNFKMLMSGYPDIEIEYTGGA
jgi:hypothetical protein